MSKDLIAVEKDIAKDLATVMPEHKDMMEYISSNSGEITRASSLFFKSQSQFMDNMLTVNKMTPMRNLKQCLAEMNKVKQALIESHFSIKKKQLEVKKKLRSLETEQDELERELLEIEVHEIEANIEQSKGYVSGAIRKLANYTEQYNNIKASMEVNEFGELDFEKEEEIYHIKTAFDQAMCASRSRGGAIDEGNHIYFSQIGINGSVAQRELSLYLAREGKIIAEGGEPSFDMYHEWLESMAKKFSGCSRQYAEKKGMSTLTERSLIKKGDTRLLEAQNASKK